MNFSGAEYFRTNATVRQFMASPLRRIAVPWPEHKVYDFLAKAQVAQAAEHNRERVQFGREFAINNEKRAILFEHPNADVQFNGVPIPQDAVLQFGIGIDQAVWEKSGDGVTFECSVVDENSAKIMLFSQYIDPKNNYRDRKWFDHSVDLKDFAGQSVSFVFSTTPGPRGDAEYDRAAWSNPEIRLREDKK